MANKPDCAASLGALSAGHLRDYTGIDGGVTVHADDSSHKVMWLFAHRAMSVDGYLSSPLAKLAIKDEPID